MGFSQAGKLHTILETNQVSERFTKREFVLTVADNPKYPQLVLMQLTGDRCSQLDGLNVGDEVIVEFSLRGREWTSPKGEVRFFNSLDAWRVEVVRASAPATGGYGGGGGAPSDYEQRGTGPDDDIPFLISDISADFPMRHLRGWP